MDLVTLAIPAFVFLMLVEYAYGMARGRDTYRLNDTVNSLSLGSLRTLGKLLFFDASVRLFDSIAGALDMIQWPSTWWAWIVGFIAYDVCYYWFHRISHERSLFWGSHVAHHQSEEFNLSTALRQTGTGFLCSWVFFIPLFLLGCPPDMYYSIAAVNLLYQFWVHTEHIGRLGVLDKVLVTPSNHRVHHASNRRYLDRNYGGVFILWDRVFGTFCEETGQEKPRFGLSQPLHSWNPLWANAHIYVDMWRAARALSWRQKASVLMASPGQLHGLLAEQGAQSTPSLAAADKSEWQKYDPAVARDVKYYVAVQFVLLLGLASYLSFAAAQLEAGQLWLGFALCALGYTALGLMLENRWLGYGLETARLVLMMLCSLLLAFSVYSKLMIALLCLISGACLASLVLPATKRLNVS